MQGLPEKRLEERLQKAAINQYRAILMELAVVQGLPEKRLRKVAINQYRAIPIELAVLQGLPEKRLEERLRKVAINQCCSLAYTSGRNSPPK